MKKRPTTRELAESRTRVRKEEMDLAIAEGRLTVRRMTSAERASLEDRRTPKERAHKGRRRRPA